MKMQLASFVVEIPQQQKAPYIFKGIPKIYTTRSDHVVGAIAWSQNCHSNAASVVIEILRQKKASYMAKGIPKIYTRRADHEVAVFALINNTCNFNIKNDE